VVGKVYEEQQRFDIFLRFQPEYRNGIEDIEASPMSLPGGGQIPRHQIAAVQALEGPKVISREGNGRFITIQCNVRGIRTAQALRAHHRIAPTPLMRRSTSSEVV